MQTRPLTAFAACVVLFAVLSASAQQPSSPHTWPTPHEGDFVAHNFAFKSGETLPEARIHYSTLGTPEKNANGQTTNAVLILHGTSGDGTQFLRDIFAGVLFGPGQLLDASRYFIVLPDNIGHGKSSKPSDGMHAHFLQYQDSDMIALQHELLQKGLGVNHLRLVLGTSMGCMHSWMWGETYPDMMDALMPLTCLPVQIAGRNRIWRKMVIDGTRQDPDWKNGDYTTQPRAALQIATDFLLIAGSAPLHLQEDNPTRDAADAYLDKFMKRDQSWLDTNDFLYAVSASRGYDPSADLNRITAPVMFVNSADDFINPPELGIAEREIKKDLHGAVGATILSTEGSGNTLILHLQHHWVTESGDTLNFSPAAATTTQVAPGLYAIVSYPTHLKGGTGQFAGATGDFTAIGEANLANGQIVLRYAGKICFPSGN